MVDVDEIIKYSHNLTLLYVEDNRDAREMTHFILEDFFDNIVVAEDGQEAYEQYLTNDIDIIITDINMPKMNGLELSKKIRQKDTTIPIVILSAHNEESFFMDSIAYGINGYLLKPIDLDQFCAIISNIVQKYQYMQLSEEKQLLLEAYQQAANESAIVSKTDTKGIITYVNDSFCKLSGYTEEELLGKPHSIIRHPDNPKAFFEAMWHTIEDEKNIWKGIVKNRAKNGKSYYTDSVIMPLLNRNGEITEYISLRHDITEIMNPTKQLHDEIDNAETPLLIYLKLENFSMLEEFYDKETLQELQEKAQHYLENKFSSLYEFDKLYFLENGEFAFVLDATPYINNMKTFIEELKRYQEIIKDEKITLNSLEYDIALLISCTYEKEKIIESVKIGIRKLLKTKKRFILANNFAQLEQNKAKKNMQTVSMIKKAIHSSNVLSYFQPIIDNQTKEIVKYESLVRIIDENEHVIAPVYFLETAKKSNYYAQITNIVLEHSFSILRNCGTDISINLSALDIEQRGMRKKILELLEEHKAHSSRIVFEILEDENINNFETVKKFISQVKEYGVKIAIDDFGAGYSNYERLLDYQPDILKIDGCLIRDIETSSYSLSAVKSIVTFAKEQKLQTIAEFIENETIYNIVKEIGVDFSQGYYFGKPAPFLKL